MNKLEIVQACASVIGIVISMLITYLSLRPHVKHNIKLFKKDKSYITLNVYHTSNFSIKITYNYKQAEIEYFIILILLMFVMDFCNFNLDILHYFNLNYYQFMILSSIIFTFCIIVFEWNLVYMSLGKLRSDKLNNKLLKHYSAYISIAIVYISLSMIAFKAIIPSTCSPIYKYGVFYGNIDMIPTYLIQILFLLSIIKIKNNIVFHCKQIVNNYKINMIYNKIFKNIR